MSINDLDTLFADDDSDHILCPNCAGVGGPECSRCRGSGYVLLASLDPDERFAAGLLPIDWGRPLGDVTLPPLDEEEQDHPDGYLTDEDETNTP